MAWLGAQPAGEIRLEVRDPSGAPMAATGRLARLDNGDTWKFQTGAKGTYTFTGLAMGRYQLEVSRVGFTTQAASLDVESSSPVFRIVILELSGASYRVDVVGTTPLAGTGLSVLEIPAPVQAATERDLINSGALDLSDLLNRRLNGVSVNELQGNPYQPDVTYRGYTASPLLGTPQGLSIYMDGVRLNQPFGDTVSWDLIPKVAILETALMPGSNPMFGLNTLGGAVSIRTKDGLTKPGTSLQLSGGSFGRRVAEFEHGGSNAKGLNWYLAGNLFFEDGWRESSASSVRQFFGRMGWQRGNTVLGLSASYANNSLNGNGLQEDRLVSSSYSSVYTLPDNTANRSPIIIVSAQHTVNSRFLVSGNAYYRYIRTNTFNGDLNEDSLDQAVYQPTAADQAALTGAGYTGFPTSGANASNTPFPFWRCIAQALQADEPAEKCNALLNRTHTEQNNAGLSGQLTWNSSPRGQRNQLTGGAAYDHSSVRFQQSTQLGYLAPDRSVIGVNAFGDGATGGTVDGEPFDTRVDLDGRIQTASVYATDTWSPSRRVSVTASARYNRTTIDNRDRIRPGGIAGSLDGSHAFGRLNPSAGVTYSPTSSLNTYLSYSEGSRAPTSIELGCADPNLPCKLPNAMAGDPPLRQVVTRTLEAGVRSGSDSKLNWSAGWFRASNRDDILFVASTQSGFGYFKNFGKTLRQGFEADTSTRIRRTTLGGAYTFLDATYQSSETVNGSSNSANETGGGLDGTVQIDPGDRIPLLPRHLFKAYADMDLTKRFTVDLGLIAVSSSLARGNENNLHQPDGKYYIGPGTSPSYAVVNLGARYRLTRWFQLFVQVNNLFDQRFYTAALLGPVGITPQGTFIARPFPAVAGQYPLAHSTFFAPGAPRGVWGGMRLSF